MWSFNRSRDKDKITNEEVLWQGPFAWPGNEETAALPSIPDLEGVYLFTFPFRDGFLVYGAGITNSTRRRFRDHARTYRKGDYNVLDVAEAQKGIRKEVWHGWGYARENREEFEAKKADIRSAVETQLQAFRIFIAEVPDKRKRERIEAAIMEQIYMSKEDWSELADRGMMLRTRANYEMPINIHNSHTSKFFGLPASMEI